MNNYNKFISTGILVSTLLFLSCNKTESHELPEGAAELENLTIHPENPDPLKELTIREDMV